MNVYEKMIYKWQFVRRADDGLRDDVLLQRELLVDAEVGVPKTSDELLKAIVVVIYADAGRFGYWGPTHANQAPTVFLSRSSLGDRRGG